MNIGFSIKDIRKHLGMTQEELSDLSGVSRVSIGNYERGDREPTVSIAIAIAEALGVTLDDLINGTFEVVLPLTGKAGIKTMLLLEERINCLMKAEPNLLEIKLTDTDSVPEVYYRGERLDSMPCGLVDISYHYHTTGDRPGGANDIHIEYYDGQDTTFPDMKTIGHKRTI